MNGTCDIFRSMRKIFLLMLALLAGQAWAALTEEECVRLALQKYEEHPNLGSYDPAQHKLEVSRISRAEAAQRVRGKDGRRLCDESALPPGQEFIHIRLISLELIRAIESGKHIKGGGTFHAIIAPQTGTILDSYRDR